MYPLNKLLTLALATTALLSTTHTHADEPTTHYYGIGVIGVATWDLGAEYTNEHLVWNLLLGRRTKNGGYELEVTAAEYERYGQTNYNASHLIFSALRYLPIFSFADIYGKVGLNNWITSIDSGGTRLKSDGGMDVALGAGLQLKFKKNDFSIRFEGKILPDISNGLNEGDIRQFTITGIGYY